MSRIGVILAGCGYLDGAEITEAVCALLFLDRAGAEVVCMAPDIEQAAVKNHLTGEFVEEKRNVLVEAARIARGKISDIAEVDPDSLDGLVLPGGFGAASNLSEFAAKGAEAKIDDGVKKMIRAIHAAGKPIGAICIAPALVALALGDKKPVLTIGEDKGTAAQLEKLGARHENSPVEGAVVDQPNRLVSCPAYMYDAPRRDIAAGIEQVIMNVMQMVKSDA